MIRVAVSGVLAFAACVPQLAFPADAQILCRVDDDCPAARICIEQIGRCIDKDSACLTNGAPSASGTACSTGDGDGICIDGACGESRCGDGWVDLARGEHCEQGTGVVCRADCTRPFCGDGIIDDDETCDSGQVEETCVGCLAACPRTTPSIGLAEDQLCIGATAVVPLPAVQLIDQGAIVRDDFYLSATNGITATRPGGVTELWRYRIRTGSFDVLQENVSSISMFSTGEMLWVSIATADRAMVKTYDAFADEETLFDEADTYVGAVTMYEGEVYIGLLDGVTRLDGAQGATTIDDDCAFAWELLGCGDELVCTTFVGDGVVAQEITAVRISDGLSRVVAQLPTTAHIGCLEDRIVWKTFSAVFQEEEPGRVALLYSLPEHVRIELPNSAPLIVREGIVALPVGTTSLDGSGYQTLRLDPIKPDAQLVVPGITLGIDRGRVLYWTADAVGALSSTLHVAFPPP